jgi:hypothetical protein
MNGSRKKSLSTFLSLGLIAGGATQVVAQDVDGQLLVAGSQITIELEAAGPEQLDGQAVFMSAGDATHVTLEITGAPANAELAGFLVAGACTGSGEVLARLGSMEVGATGEGELMAELPIELETIASEPIAIEVRPVDDAESRAIACGAHGSQEAPAAAPADAAPIPTPDAEPIPEPAPDPQPLPDF